MPSINVHGSVYRYRRNHPEKDRWEGMVYNMAHDARLDREGGLRLLKAAREIPVSNHTDDAALQAAFDRRFGGSSNWTAHRDTDDWRSE